MTRPRGGYIGFNGVPAAAGVNSAASGIWTLREAEALKRAGTWPTAPSPPSAPTSLAASAGNAQLSLTWTAPASDISITDYFVEYTPSGGSASTVNTGSSSASYTLTGLTNGTSYTVRVAAISAAGTGAYSGTASGTPNSFVATAVVLTSGSSYSVPAGATSMKAWAIGGGGAFSNSCDGGGNQVGSNAAVAVRTYNVSGGTVTYSIAGAQLYECDGFGAAAPSTTVTYSGVSVVGGGGIRGASGNQGCTNADTCGTAGNDVSGLNAAVSLAGGSISGRGIGATGFIANGSAGAVVLYFT